MRPLKFATSEFYSEASVWPLRTSSNPRWLPAAYARKPWRMLDHAPSDCKPEEHFDHRIATDAVIGCWSFTCFHLHTSWLVFVNAVQGHFTGQTCCTCGQTLSSLQRRIWIKRQICCFKLQPWLIWFLDTRIDLGSNRLFLSHGALRMLILFPPPPDFWYLRASSSPGRRVECASTSCRTCRSPWTSSNTDRSVNYNILNILKAAIYLLYFISFKSFQVKLVNIRNDDIADGNPKLTLGLIWTIILHFQVME